jgi:hypothetical protein
MSAPKFVPVVPIGAYRDGEHLPPALDWMADRPGELSATQASGYGQGSAGPSQGYGIKLANRFHGKLNLVAGENEHDVMAGCLGVALKRASSYGRAPVIHDFEIAFTLFGFLGDDQPSADQLEVRRKMFEAAGHHYEVQRSIADSISEDSLRRTPHVTRLFASRDFARLFA